jgi:hypothetical protein
VAVFARAMALFGNTWTPVAQQRSSGSRVTTCGARSFRLRISDSSASLSAFRRWPSSRLQAHLFSKPPIGRNQVRVVTMYRRNDSPCKDSHPDHERYHHTALDRPPPFTKRPREADRAGFPYESNECGAENRDDRDGDEQRRCAHRFQCLVSGTKKQSRKLCEPFHG